MIEKLTRGLDSATQKMVVVVKYAAVTLFMIADVILFLSVLNRNIVGLPWVWYFEFTQFLIIWYICLSASVAVFQHQMIAIPLFVDMFSDKIKKYAILFIDIVCIGFSFIYSKYGIELVKVGFSRTTGVLPIPIAIPYASLPTMGVLMLIFYMNILIKHLKGDNLDISR